MSGAELRSACLAVVQHAGRIQRVELTRLVAGVFGWQRQGTLVQDRIERAISHLIRSGSLMKVDDEWLELGPQVH